MSETEDEIIITDNYVYVGRDMTPAEKRAHRWWMFKHRWFNVEGFLTCAITILLGWIAAWLWQHS